MLKKTVTTITENKGVLVKKALIVGGTIVGGIIANGMLDRLNAQKPDVVVIEVFEDIDEIATNDDTPAVLEDNDNK